MNWGEEGGFELAIWLCVAGVGDGEEKRQIEDGRMGGCQGMSVMLRLSELKK